MDKGQWIRDSGQGTVDKGQWIRGSGQGTMDKGLWIRDCGHETVPLLWTAKNKVILEKQLETT